MTASTTFRTVLLASVAALAIGGCETMNSAWDSTKSFVARDNVKLSGANEVPPVTTSASGSGKITIKDDRSVSGSVKTSGVAGIAAHIHQGAPGKNGPVVIALVKSADGTTWSVPAGAKLTDAQYKEYKAGNLYVNVHSALYKGGEIRGQITP